MVEHTLRTVHESLVQGYCATADCATGDYARLHGKRYYCTTGKEKNTTSYACNNKQYMCHSCRYKSEVSPYVVSLLVLNKLIWQNQVNKMGSYKD